MSPYRALGKSAFVFCYPAPTRWLVGPGALPAEFDGCQTQARVDLLSKAFKG